MDQERGSVRNGRLAETLVTLCVNDSGNSMEKVQKSVRNRQFAEHLSSFFEDQIREEVFEMGILRNIVQRPVAFFQEFSK